MKHDTQNHRFVIENDGSDPYLEYRIKNRTVTVLHIVVPKPLSGKGLAAQLANTFYHWAEEQNLTIESECSYMDAWLKRHLSHT